MAPKVYAGVGYVTWSFQVLLSLQAPEEALDAGKRWDWQIRGVHYAAQVKGTEVFADEADDLQRAVLAYRMREERALEVMQKIRRGEERSAAWLPSMKSVKLKEKVFEDRGAALAVYTGHDASIAVSQDGRVLCVLEIERLLGVRYARLKGQGSEFWEQIFRAISTVRDHCPGGFPQHFKHGVMVADHVSCWQLFTVIPLIVEEYFPVEKWHWVDHHEAHALMAYHSSPFRTALIVTYDGGGNDGSFNAYVGRAVGDGKVERIAQLDYNLGEMYNFLGGLLPEVSGLDTTQICDLWRLGQPVLLDQVRKPELGTAGKLMGYAAVAPADDKLTSVLEELFEGSGCVYGHASDAFGYFPFQARSASWKDLSFVNATLPVSVLEAACTSPESQRILGASIEKAFESIAFGIVWSLLRHVGLDKVEGLALSGGCALSIRTNQLLHDRLNEIGLGFFVPPAPNDCGLSVGGLYSVTPPWVRQPLQYLGFELWDKLNLGELARKRGAVKLSELGGIEYLAALLTGTVDSARLPSKNGTVQRHPIVAIVRGRQEFGPRALGHRSLLAVVTDDEMPKRMNRLKVREWYRPVAPMIAEEALTEVFGRIVPSPYMTLAPVVKPEIRKRFPALAHFDGTARHQSVSKEDEPWIHALLTAVGRLAGLAALINTSFNTKGKPIVNTARECLQMLDRLPDLDFVLIEDWLFHRRLTRVAKSGRLTCPKVLKPRASECRI